MQEDDDKQFDIGNQDHFDHAPDELKDHLVQAFVHAAGKGKHPGKYAGPQPEPPPDDAITEADLQRTHESEEASAKKMHAAQTGGSGISLGPSQIEQQAVKQRTAINQQSDLQASQQAQQVAGQQVPSQPPPAPTGPQGTSIPYSTQKGAVGGPGNAPKPQAPAQPSPDQGSPSDEEQPPGFPPD